MAATSSGKGAEISDEELAAWVEASVDDQRPKGAGEGRRGNGRVSFQPFSFAAAVPPVPAPKPRGGGAGKEGVVMDRLRLYQQAKAEAEMGGDTSKARRYKRAIDTIEQVSTV